MLYSTQLYRKAQLFVYLTKPVPSEVKSEIKIGWLMQYCHSDLFVFFMSMLEMYICAQCSSVGYILMSVTAYCSLGQATTEFSWLRRPTDNFLICHKGQRTWRLDWPISAGSDPGRVVGKRAKLWEMCIGFYLLKESEIEHTVRCILVYEKGLGHCGPWPGMSS